MKMLSSYEVEKIIEFLNSIDASMIISIISLVISFFVFAKDLWHERLRIDVTLVKWFASLGNDAPFFLWLVIQNDSSLPFSISKMELIGRKKYKGKKVADLYAVGQGSKRVVSTIQRSNNKEKVTKEIYSNDYPIVINAYEGVGGYFHFLSNTNAVNFEDQTFTLKIHTNRGRRRIKDVRLNYKDNILRAYQNQMEKAGPSLDAQGNPIEYTKERL